MPTTPPDARPAGGGGRAFGLARPDLRRPLAAVVLAHLTILLAHAHAHRQAAVGLSPAATVFVYVVILAGPVLGLVLMIRAARPGALVLAWSLGGALAFGAINHFVVRGPDHVAQVAARWQHLFSATAILLAASEAVGAFLALRFLTGGSGR